MINQNSNEIFTPSVSSGIRFFNSDSKIDKTSLSFTYWNKILKITINPIIVSEGSANKVDMDNHIDIYLTPFKAQYLLNCIQKFRANPDMFPNIGIPTNKGAVYIANGKKMYGIDGTFLVIVLIDENGTKVGEAAYEFNSDIYAVENFRVTSNGPEFEKNREYSRSIELDLLETILNSYVVAYTNAFASSVMEANKINDNRVFNFIKDAREKLGISKTSDSNGKYNKSSWYNSSSVSSESPKTTDTSYDDVMNDIASLMD